MQVDIFTGIATIITAVGGGSAISALIINRAKAKNLEIDGQIKLEQQGIVSFQTILESYKNMTEILKKDLYVKEQELKNLREKQTKFRDLLINNGFLKEVEEIDKEYA